MKGNEASDGLTGPGDLVQHSNSTRHCSAASWRFGLASRDASLYVTILLPRFTEQDA